MEAPKKFRSKPVQMEAMQYTGKNAEQIAKWTGEGVLEHRTWDPVNLHIKTREGLTVCEPNAWVCKDSEGGFYPCADSIFRRKYEEVK